ncbi:MAG: restriction system-associated AAA family ATPase [Algibacter sp.]
MKLKKLKLLSSFRGLPSGYHIDFLIEKENNLSVHPICFIGLNGSGKSNILELISEIFYYLETYQRSSKKDIEKFNTPFGFEIEYYIPKLTVYENGFYSGEFAGFATSDSIDDKLIVISKKVNELPEVKVDLDGKNIKLDNSNSTELFAVLPRYVLGYSSGMNELLSNPFIKMDFDYLKELKKKTNDAVRATLEMNRLFYLNYNSSKLVTICNFIFNKDATQPIKEALKLIELDSFSIHIKLWKKKEKKDYLPSELNQAIFSFKDIDILFDEKENKSYKYTDVIEYHFNFKLTEAVIEGFKKKFLTSYDLFRVLYNFQILNLGLIGDKTVKKVRSSSAKSRDNLSDLIPKQEKDKLVFNIDSIAFKKEKVKDLVYFKQLSDGEHQLLQVLGSIALFDSKSILFLLDEPTTHFNPEWRSKFIYLINQCVGDGQREQEIMLTTHSPFIVSDSKRENVIRTINGDKKTYEIPEDETYGASIRFLLSKLFNQKNSIGEYSFQDLQRLSDKISAIENEEDIQFIKDESIKFGDSPEKIMLFHMLSQKIKTL